jgi:hypothetical protein
MNGLWFEYLLSTFQGLKNCDYFEKLFKHIFFLLKLYFRGGKNPYNIMTRNWKWKKVSLSYI